MKILKTVSEILQFQKENLAKNGANFVKKTYGFVPTMGGLHAGHFSLIKRSRSENDFTIVSIYLNETQFNDKNDLATYPSSLTEDLKNLEALNIDAVFLPNYQEMYPDQYQYQVHETKDSLDLCGADRPGHFTGVLTVVLKLLNIVKPDRAYFGEKDFQQLHLIKGMVKAFFLQVEVIACPIQRDEFGLALSSRNKKLSSDQLDKARRFAHILSEKKELQEARSDLAEADIDVDYLVDKNSRRFAAVRIGSVRLIDNVKI